MIACVSSISVNISDCFKNTCLHIFLFYLWNHVMLPAIVKITLVVAWDTLCAYNDTVHMQITLLFIYMVPAYWHIFPGYLNCWCLWLATYTQHIYTYLCWEWCTCRWISVCESICNSWFIPQIPTLMGYMGDMAVNTGSEIVGDAVSNNNTRKVLVSWYTQASQVSLYAMLMTCRCSYMYVLCWLLGSLGRLSVRNILF